jgi:transglutaminase-like putative cysteine protease
MEVRMQPRSEAHQRCLEFRLTTEPQAQVLQYRDSYHNHVHHFNIPGQHNVLTITAETLVQLAPTDVLPEALPADAWEKLDAMTATDDHWFFLEPSSFTRHSEHLYKYISEINLNRNDDPLTTLRNLNTTIYQSFTYVPHSTTVDSPIDDALRTRRGVCQDFAHIMIALARMMGIPCRYVSGYLYHRSEDHDRSEEDATHAWVETLLPDLGWVGFDPTNDLVAYDRHIRTAVGRDYADVPPTLGVFKGDATTELDVGVRVSPSEAPIEDEELLPMIEITYVSNAGAPDEQYQQQQQQQ